jgi:preprotein translocase subunit Sec61beta
MTYDEQKLDLDPTLIILGLGYATALLVIIGWLATL